jgi:hypothetical protein
VILLIALLQINGLNQAFLHVKQNSFIDLRKRMREGFVYVLRLQTFLGELKKNMAAMKYVVTVQQDGGQDVTCRGDNEL